MCRKGGGVKGKGNGRYCEVEGRRAEVVEVKKVGNWFSSSSFFSSTTLPLLLPPSVPPSPRAGRTDAADESERRRHVRRRTAGMSAVVMFGLVLHHGHDFRQFLAQD